MPNCPHTNERLLTWKINNNFQFLHQKQEQKQKKKKVQLQSTFLRALTVTGIKEKFILVCFSF
jgi:hypothetical protein